MNISSTMKTALLATILAFAIPVGASQPRSAIAKADFQRETPCPANGAIRGSCPGYVIDHIKAIACGGEDKPYNMQWQTIAKAKAKDKWERAGCIGSATQTKKTAKRVKTSDPTCHTGPRGGRYRIVNGHKRYGC